MIKYEIKATFGGGSTVTTKVKAKNKYNAIEKAMIVLGVSVEDNDLKSVIAKEV